MKNQRQIVVMCFTALIVLTPLLVTAQPQTKIRHNRTHTRLWDELSLTSEQKAKIAELHKETKAAHKEHVANIKEVRKQTRKELLKEKPSKTTLSGLAKEAGELERVYSEKRNDHLLKIKETLTPEQFVKLLDKDRYVRSRKENTGKRKKYNNRDAAERQQSKLSR